MQPKLQHLVTYVIETMLAWCQPAQANVGPVVAWFCMLSANGPISSMLHKNQCVHIVATHQHYPGQWINLLMSETSPSCCIDSLYFLVCKIIPYFRLYLVELELWLVWNCTRRFCNIQRGNWRAEILLYAMPEIYFASLLMKCSQTYMVYMFSGVAQEIGCRRRAPSVTF